MLRASGEGNAPAGHGAHAASRLPERAFFATATSQIRDNLRALELRLQRLLEGPP
jgi:hypothetical protein